MDIPNSHIQKSQSFIHVEFSYTLGHGTPIIYLFIYLFWTGDTCQEPKPSTQSAIKIKKINKPQKSLSFVGGVTSARKILSESNTWIGLTHKKSGMVINFLSEF